ncbi:MarC family NAAT transporter [Nonlabens antarcticus]|uniref:MarC family NAAT transporter n=1 Tax=Nonlabens antarcticus TaxID=392714 RepID=UPI003742465F
MTTILMAFTAILSVVNPLGTVPIFVGLTTDYTPTEKRKAALLTAINTGVILLISFFVGKYVLSFFGISIHSLRIAGGLIIVSSGFALLTGTFSNHKGMDKRVKDDAYTRDSISLTPLAMPMLAGPGTISLLIGYYQEFPLWVDRSMIIIAVIAVAISIFLVLSSSSHIVKFLGASGINAVSRIVGFIVIAIGIEYISSSVISIMGSLLS